MRSIFLHTMSLRVHIRSTVIFFALIAPLTSTWPHHSKFLQKFSPYFHSLSVYEPSKRAANRLLNNFIGDDGRVYACSGKNFFAFETNGSIAWTLHLSYTCNVNIAPVHGGSRTIYLVAENRVLKIYPSKIGTSEPAVEVFFGPGQGREGPGEIIGVSASIFSSCVLITVKNRGLFAYRLYGKLIWSAGPVLYQHGYRQGCRKNITECYFTSAAVIDHCEASVYIFNTVGELYSLSVGGPYFKWIQDLSSFGNILTITPGNNGLLYVTVPDSGLILALDVSTGNILWQGSIGPLNSADYEPVVDANGWISFGSLDGYLYSFSPAGDLKKFPRSASLNSVIQVNPVLDCSGYAVYISETEMEGKIAQTIAEYTVVSALKPKNVAFTLLVPASGSIVLSESDPSKFLFKLSQSDLQNFVLDERTLLAFFAVSRKGNPFPCRTARQKLASSCSQVKPKSISIYLGNERTIILFLLIESFVLVLLAAAVWYCCIFWKKKKLQGQNLGKFLEKRVSINPSTSMESTLAISELIHIPNSIPVLVQRSLQSKKKAFDRMITDLEQKASEEAAANEVLEKLGDLVRGREDIRRKLSTTYSLGRDADTSRTKSLLPMYNGRTRSYSFQGAKKESVSIFHTLSDSTSLEEYSSPVEEAHNDLSEDGDILANAKAKGKSPVEVESSSSEDGIHDIASSPSTSQGFVSSLFLGHSFSEIEEVTKEDGDDGKILGNTQSESSSSRRRTMSMSFTN